MNRIEMIISSREKDLGGFSVRRVLPYASHRMVGPFIFFDHMGPAEFPPGQGVNVRPHPHIGLATVTYLFEGVIRHRDSLGSDQLIEPGAVNWMTAGHGIVHSERTPEALLGESRKMHGIQCWVALPEADEETDPSFTHYPSNVLPEFQIDGVWIKLLLGSLFSHSSPVSTHSELFYAEARFDDGQTLEVTMKEREGAIYLVDGEIEVDGQRVSPCTMVVAKSGEDLSIKSQGKSRVMILGGKPVGAKKIFWNLVSSSSERLNEAKAEWARFGEGPTKRFKKIPGDELEFIPLPVEPGNPRGTIM